MLSYSQPRTKALSESVLRQHVAKALSKGWIRESFHSATERAHRNVSFDDVLFGLEKSDWVLAAPPNYDDDHKGWEYLIKTTDIEGVELELKIAAKPVDGTVIVISKF
jgi:hypothetical protein